MKEIITLLEKVCGDNYTEEWKKLNFMLIPTTVINASIGNEVGFNDLYQMLLNSGFEPIKRTKSGGISIDKNQRLYHHKVYDVKQYASVVEITVCLPVNYKMRSYRIQWRINNYKDEAENEQLITGRKSFNIFKKECLKDGIRLEDYEISKEEGIEINKQIDKPDIRLFNDFINVRKTIKHANHLDFHKFYMGGLKKARPEFVKTIDRLAAMSKTNKMYKTVLAATIGYMHSPCCGYKYAQLAYDAIHKAYEDYYKVMKALEKTNEILATNTDGIWYVGKEFHGLLESEEVGGWSNDHFDCTIRFKSAGSYEYIENDKYMPVVRGRTNLDKIKNRAEWNWGDIMLPSASIQTWSFKEGVGITWQKLM